MAQIYSTSRAREIKTGAKLQQRASQYMEYQAFLRQLEDGTVLGRIAHDTTRVDAMPEQNLGRHYIATDARWLLREAVTCWAHGNALSVLPSPAPRLTERPSDVAAMITIEVPYSPQAPL